MANERLYQFPSKVSPTPADIVYVGDAANAFNEVQCTIAQIIAAYPNLSNFAGLTLGANTYAYVNNSSVMVAGSITAFGVSLLADANAAAGRTTLGVVIGTDVEAHSAILDSIAGLTLVANDLIYATAATTFGVIAAANSSVLVTSAGGVPSLSQTLPSAVQANITALGAQSQALNMNSHQINNVSDPTSAQDACTKAYADAIASGLNPIPGVVAASTTALTVTYNNGTLGVGATLTNADTQATFSLDGQSPTVGQRVLIKDQASSLQNGIYTVTNVGSGATNWVLTRATDYDTASEISPGDLVGIEAGTVNAKSSYFQTASVSAVGTDAITFSVFFAPGSYLSSTLTSAHIYVGNGSNVGTNVAVSGDLTLANTGAFTIANSAVTNAKLANMNDQTIKGNVSGGAAAPVDLTAAQVLTFLNTVSNQVVQRVSTLTGAVATGTTVIPFDDTIPQNTEGDEYMTLAITPKSASNILVIDVTWIGCSTATSLNVLAAALFQDSTANALAAAISLCNIANINFRYIMTAGTTSATTFKVRAGANISGTTTFNGQLSGRIFGGKMASSIMITEYST